MVPYPGITVSSQQAFASKDKEIKGSYNYTLKYLDGTYQILLNNFILS